MDAEPDSAGALPDHFCLAEEPSCFAAPAGIPGELPETLQNARRPQLCLDFGGDGERIKSVAFCVL
jgi:hypothetical protein